MTVDPRDFLLNTDYEMDKIVYFNTGSLNSGSSTSIQHNLGFIPLVFGVCSFNSDFSDPRTIPYNYQLQSDYVTFSATADGTNINLSFNTANGSPGAIYYRIYAFEPSNSAATIAPTNNHASQFILNTDYNYCKLCKKGIIDSDGSVSHNLGYIPQVLAWSESGGVITPIDESTPSDPITNQPTQVIVTTSSITFQNIGKAHYRIYYDEA